MMATMQDFGGLLFGMGGSGLEDYLSPQQTQGIQNQAMLQAAAALLQAGGPSARPISLGQALGGALQAGQQGYSQAQQGAVQTLMAREKLREAKMNADWAAGGGVTPITAGTTPTAGAATPVGVAGGLPAPAGARTPTGMVNLMGVDVPAAQAALLRQLPRKEAIGEIYKQATNQFTQMTPAEVASFGLPAGSIVYRGPTGKPEIISKPDQYSQMTAEEIAAAGLPSNAVIYKSPQNKPEIISRPDYQFIETPAGGKQLIDMNNPLGTVPKNVKNPTPPSAGGSGPVINTRTPPIGGTGGAPVYAGGFAPALKPEQIMSTVAAWDKDYRMPVENILASYKIVEDLATTGGAGLSDYGILIKSLKALEPNSAVMQGEADSARQMQSLADRMQGLVDRIGEGGIGAEQARLDLVNLARTSANVAIDAYNRQAGRKAQLMGQFANGNVIGSVFQPFEKPSALTSKAQMEKEIRAKTVAPTSPVLRYNRETGKWSN
jgi:hypothetical protein